MVRTHATICLLYSMSPSSLRQPFVQPIKLVSMNNWGHVDKSSKFNFKLMFDNI